MKSTSSARSTKPQPATPIYVRRYAWTAQAGDEFQERLQALRHQAVLLSAAAAYNTEAGDDGLAYALEHGIDRLLDDIKALDEEFDRRVQVVRCSSRNRAGAEEADTGGAQ